MIGGGRPLEGVVTISGAKNSAIALIPAAILPNLKLFWIIYRPLVM